MFRFLALVFLSSYLAAAAGVRLASGGPDWAVAVWCVIAVFGMTDAVLALRERLGEEGGGVE